MCCTIPAILHLAPHQKQVAPFPGIVTDAFLGGVTLGILSLLIRQLQLYEDRKHVAAMSVSVVFVGLPQTFTPMQEEAPLLTAEVALKTAPSVQTVGVTLP